MSSGPQPPRCSGRVVFEEIDQYAASFSPTWNLDFRQVSASEGEGGCRYATDGVGLVYEERYPAAIALCGTVGPGLIGFVLSDERGRDGRWLGADHPEGGLAYADERKEVDVVFPRASVNVVGVVRAEAFRGIYERLTARPVDELFRGDRLFLQLAPGRRSRLVRAWRRLLDDGSDSPGITFSLVETLVEATHDAGSARGTDWPRARRLFRRAIDMCEADPMTARSPGELATRLGVSLRSLQLAFEACAEIPPGRYLRMQRLNQVHRALCRLDPVETSVHAVALDRGFMELGRFAGEYRRIFGELPSETLRRSPAPPRQVLPRLR